MTELENVTIGKPRRYDQATPMCGLPCGCIRTSNIQHTCDQHKAE